MCNELLNNEGFINIQTGEKLDLFVVKRLKDKSLLKNKTELWIEWNFEKNIKLNFDIWRLSSSSGKKVWWICLKCKKSYANAVYSKINVNQGCPYCCGRKASIETSLASLNPELASEWHPTKNGDSTPDDVTCGSNKKVWWLCIKGHEWDAPVTRRDGGAGCPYCANKKIWIGFNDMWTTNSKLAKLLANPDDGYKYTQNSNKKLDWKCSVCNEIIKGKLINNINKQGLSCENCCDGKSYPEKFIFHMLKQSEFEVVSEKTFDWSATYRYDFYIPSLNMIIETHGMQHYVEGFKHFRTRTLEEEQANDKYKYELAIANGIKPENYIVIDCRYSDLEYIKNSVLNSEIKRLLQLDNINWRECHEYSCSSLIKDACRLWNSGIKSTNDIAKIMGLERGTISRYLKKGDKINICNYNPLDSNRRKVICLTTNEKFSSIKEGKNKYGSSNILQNCRSDSRYTYSGIHPITKEKLKWMFLEDYEKMIEEQNKIS